MYRKWRKKRKKKRQNEELKLAAGTVHAGIWLEQAKGSEATASATFPICQQLLLYTKRKDYKMKRKVTTCPVSLIVQQSVVPLTQSFVASKLSLDNCTSNLAPQLSTFRFSSFTCKTDQDETNWPIKLVIATWPEGLMYLKYALLCVFRIAQMIAVHKQ